MSKIFDLFRQLPYNRVSDFVAVVAQLVEHRIVIPVVAGSSPVDRPNLFPDFTRNPV